MEELTKTEEMLLICIWRLKDQAYGYRIRKYISGMLQKDFTYGNLYSALSQLVKKGYVEKFEENPVNQKQGKPRNYYTISERGIGALKDSRKTYSILWDGISDYSLDNS